MPRREALHTHKASNSESQVEAAVSAGGSALEALCEAHGGLVKPSITFFGEALPTRFGDLVPDDFEACDCLIVVGTSLKVQPFALLPGMTNAHVPRLLINRERVGGFCSGDEGTADFFCGGECDDGIRALAALCGFEERLDALIAERL